MRAPILRNVLRLESWRQDMPNSGQECDKGFLTAADVVLAEWGAFGSGESSTGWISLFSPAHATSSASSVSVAASASTFSPSTSSASSPSSSLSLLSSSPSLPSSSPASSLVARFRRYHRQSQFAPPFLEWGPFFLCHCDAVIQLELYDIRMIHCGNTAWIVDSGFATWYFFAVGGDWPSVNQ